MTFEEINLMFPLELRRTIYQWTRRALGHSNEPRPKSLSKTPIRVEYKTMITLTPKT
jgi:hypothetical protein